MQYINHYKSPIGGITLGSDGENIIGLWFDGEKYFGDTLYEQTEEKELPVFDLTKQWLDIYFSGNEPDFMPPIKEYGSEFRLTVWEELKKIPYGNTVTYGEIADTIGKNRGIEKMSSQAVGGAVGHNSISIIIPVSLSTLVILTRVVLSSIKFSNSSISIFPSSLTSSISTLTPLLSK